MRWRWSLPAASLTLFALITLQEMRWNYSSRYFWWAGMRFSKGQKPHTPVQTCRNATVECAAAFDPEFIWVSPGIIPRTFMLLSLPAFACGIPLVGAAEHYGIPGYPVFLILLPILVALWCYFCGRLFEWLLKRRGRGKSAA